MQQARIYLRSGRDAEYPSWMNPDGRDLNYGRGIAYALPRLDSLAREMGVRALREFVVIDDDLARDAAALWFEPAEALPTVSMLLVRIAQMADGSGVNRGGLLIVKRELMIFDLLATFGILSASLEREDAFRIYIG